MGSIYIYRGLGYQNASTGVGYEESAINIV